MKLTDAEWQLMNALWKSHPATARQIEEHLPSGVTWAYTTIKTMLSRLVGKRAINERKQGKTSVYEPVITQDKAQRSAFKSLLNQAFEGAMGPLVHCLVEEKQLSAGQRRTLIKILEQEDLGKE
jgi:BlaI family penicillinase repressor